jgi:hypothetical protein
VNPCSLLWSEIIQEGAFVTCDPHWLSHTLTQCHVQVLRRILHVSYFGRCLKISFVAHRYQIGCSSKADRYAQHLSCFLWQDQRTSTMLQNPMQKNFLNHVSHLAPELEICSSYTSVLCVLWLGPPYFSLLHDHGTHCLIFCLYSW